MLSIVTEPREQEVGMKVSNDKRHATVEIHGSYSAGELEGLIEQLSALRAQMSPAVPTAPPMTNRTEDSAAARSRGDPLVQVAVMRDGMTRFWIRHGGLGWFAFNLPVQRATQLAQHIIDVAAPHEQRSDDLFKRKRRHSDLSH
jgi:hypothetical protein